MKFSMKKHLCYFVGKVVPQQLSESFLFNIKNSMFQRYFGSIRIIIHEQVGKNQRTRIDSISVSCSWRCNLICFQKWSASRLKYQLKRILQYSSLSFPITLLISLKCDWILVFCDIPVTSTSIG